MWPHILALLPLPWSKTADVSWVPSLCKWEQQIHGQTIFPLEKSRFQVLIRFSSHELIAQHRSKHQVFCHYLALVLLSSPLAQNAAGKEHQLQGKTIPHLWGWGKEGQTQEKRCAQKRWLSPFQLPSQITSQKTHPCTFTVLLTFSPVFDSYKTRKKLTPLPGYFSLKPAAASPVQISALHC